jgi:nucleolar GTP-binding protein
LKSIFRIKIDSNFNFDFFLLKKYFDDFRKENLPIMEMSNLNEEGVMAVRNEACERLLASRVEIKIKSSKVNDFLNRLHLAEPKKRDNIVI